MSADAIHAIRDLLPALSKVGIGTGVFVIIGIMAWRDSWPWKRGAK